MKYINQLNFPDIPYVTRTDLEGAEREKGLNTTIRSSGCGLCAAIMVADRLLVDYTFDLTDAIELSYAVKANYKKGTCYKRFAPAFAEKMGLQWEATNDPEALRNCRICCVGRSWSKTVLLRCAIPVAVTALIRRCRRAPF